MVAHPLEQWLEANGKTRSELAKAAGVSRMAIWRICSGQTELSVSLLSKVSNATGIPIGDLIVHREAAQ